MERARRKRLGDYLKPEISLQWLAMYATALGREASQKRSKHAMKCKHSATVATATPEP